MLISSYEGVLKKYKSDGFIVDKVNFHNDLIAIKKYIESNRDFLLMTKNKPNYLLNVTEKYKIPYNYISFYDGLVTLDDEGSLLNEEKIFLSDAKKIIDSIKYLKLEGFVKCYNKDGLTTLDDVENFVLIEILLMDLRNITQELKGIDIGYTINSRGIRLHKKISKDKIIDKIKILTYSKDITMISDNSSDIGLLLKYDGYCIKNGIIDKNNIENIKTVPNIKTLIKNIK